MRLQLATTKRRKLVRVESRWISRRSEGLVRAGRYDTWQDAFEAIKQKRGPKLRLEKRAFGDGTRRKVVKLNRSMQRAIWHLKQWPGFGRLEAS